jgi:hypothetical protein
VELADVVRQHGAEILQQQSLSSVQRRALAAVEACRTPALGGHVESCDRCGASRTVYHSCRNRHCPKCQVLAKERWVEARCARLLPVEYFHVVFTLPHELNDLARTHPKLLLDLLFHSAWSTLRQFAADPQHLGAELGVTAVLHTWSQTLAHHVHLHCLVTAGGLAPAGDRWVAARHGFLFPVRALSRVFRGKVLAGLWQARERGALADGDVPRRLRRRLTRHDWVVYCKPPFAGPEHLVKYLGRYTHRIAISNDRLLALEDGHVTFAWRDRTQGDRLRPMTLPAAEFLRRFVLHVLPDGFQRIRHYGLHANRRGTRARARARALLGAPPEGRVAPEAETAAVALLRLTGIDITRCPACSEGRLRVTLRLAPAVTAAGPQPFDTS